MRQVNIEIFNTARSECRPDEVKRWLEYLGTTEQYVDDIYQEVMDEEGITNSALIIALAAKRCYMSFEPGLNPNVTKVRSEWVEYIDNILKQGHGSVLEHSVYTFAIEGVSRVFTAEMNRHRAGWAISEGSMRFIRFNDIPYWVPTSITLTEAEQALMMDTRTKKFTPDEQAMIILAQKKMASQQVFQDAFGDAERHYGKLQGIWGEELAPEAKFAGKKHVTSMMRRVIPMGVASGGIWTGNMRAFRHVMAMRASAAAEEEMVHAFSRIGKVMVEAEPAIFGDFAQTPEGFWIPKYPKV